MKRIYTRSGDNGTTRIHGGSRIPKTDIRIEANGCLDELNVSIGVARTFLPVGHKWQESLKNIQTTLMSVMSIVATPDYLRNKNPNLLPPDCVEELECLIDNITTEQDDADYFILPGGSPAASFLHRCRVDARRAERRLWKLNEDDDVPDLILRYLNRLSDLFFTMARGEARIGILGEEHWKLFSYKRDLK